MRYDPYGTIHPDYDPAKTRFKLYVRGYEPDDEPDWQYKLVLIDSKYQDSDGLPIDSIPAGNSWSAAFATAGRFIDAALASNECVF